MRHFFLASLLFLAGCGRQLPEIYKWSFAPQDNLLARLAREPTRYDDFFLNLNFSVIALQARARQQPGLAHCELTPLGGCDYEVRLVEKAGARTECQRVLFHITDEPPGKRRVSEMRMKSIDCPADIR